MADLNIKKGHNIRISGVPSDEVQIGLKPKTVAIHPTDFRTLRSKILVKEGDTIKIGSPLFQCKSQSNIFPPSPGSGIVTSIQFGPRRVVEKIIIELSETEESDCHDSFHTAEILYPKPARMKTAEIMRAKLESGLNPEIAACISTNLVVPVNPNKMLNPYNIIPEEKAP